MHPAPTLPPHRRLHPPCAVQALRAHQRRGALGCRLHRLARALIAVLAMPRPQRTQRRRRPAVRGARQPDGPRAVLPVHAAASECTARRAAAAAAHAGAPGRGCAVVGGRLGGWDRVGLVSGRVGVVGRRVCFTPSSPPCILPTCHPPNIPPLCRPLSTLLLTAGCGPTSLEIILSPLGRASAACSLGGWVGGWVLPGSATAAGRGACLSPIFPCAAYPLSGPPAHPLLTC